MKHLAIFLLSLFAFTATHAQKISFSVNEIGEGNCTVVFDLTNNQVTATKSNGQTLFSHHLGQKKYDQSLDVIGFSFSDKSTPVMKYDDYKDFLIVSSSSSNIKYKKGSDLYMFKAQNISLFSSLFNRLCNAIKENLVVSFPTNRSFTINGESFEMVKVVGGTFIMGATPEQGDVAYESEKPAHEVTLSDYFIGVTEVTQDLWLSVMGNNPSHFKGRKLPVESVSYNDCKDFITKLNLLTSENFRLPTEAEWEYAARGGNKSVGYKYSGSNNIDDVAWYCFNSGDKNLPITDDMDLSIILNNNDRTHEVGTKSANELGIYDMSGNVWEWCDDRFGDYCGDSIDNPRGPSSGSFCVCRGGSWYNEADYSRVAYRFFYQPDYCEFNLGFRLVLVF